MSPEMRATLVTFALKEIGGSLDDAWTTVDEVVAEHGDPVDENAVRRVMEAVIELAPDTLVG
jgi:hypothetical protein